MRILSIDGGGYLGLATAAFIESVEEHFDTSFHSRFDLFCGTSTGAIIALALASGLSGARVRELYEDFGPKLFLNRFPGERRLRWAVGLILTRYGNWPLRRALMNAFGDNTLGDIHRMGKRVLIPAFSVTAGRPRIFKTDHSEALSRDNRHLVREIALASSAAPVYLPLGEIRDPATGIEESYCDGGVFANHPALLGFAEAVYHCSADPAKIRILSISTPRASLAERESARNFMQRFLLRRGLIPWASKLSSIFIDSTSMIVHETLRRIVALHPGAIYERIELQKPGGVEMDIATGAATRTLRQIGSEAASLGTTRERLRPILEH